MPHYSFHIPFFQEDEIIIQMVNKHGPKKWSTIAQALPGRIGKQCRERYGMASICSINSKIYYCQSGAMCNFILPSIKVYVLFGRQFNRAIPLIMSGLYILFILTAISDIGLLEVFFWSIILEDCMAIAS